MTVKIEPKMVIKSYLSDRDHLIFGNTNGNRFNCYIYCLDEELTRVSAYDGLKPVMG